MKRQFLVAFPIIVLFSMLLYNAFRADTLRNYLKTVNRHNLRYQNNAQASLIRPR